MLSHLNLESTCEGGRQLLLPVLKVRTWNGRWRGQEWTDELEHPSSQKQAQGHTSPRADGDWHGLHTRWLAQDSEAKQTSCSRGQVPLVIWSPPPRLVFQTRRCRVSQKVWWLSCGSGVSRTGSAEAPASYTIPSPSRNGFTFLGHYFPAPQHDSTASALTGPLRWTPEIPRACLVSSGLCPRDGALGPAH